MNARHAITALLAVAALLTVGSGVGFAQGLSDSTSAATQQYGTTPAPPPPPPAPAPRQAAPSQEILGEIGEVEEETPAAQPAPQAQPAPAQAPVQAESGELPFTGFAVGGTLLLGAVLLAGGFALRRSTRTRDSAS